MTDGAASHPAPPGDATGGALPGLFRHAGKSKFLKYQ